MTAFDVVEKHPRMAYLIQSAVPGAADLSEGTFEEFIGLYKENPIEAIRGMNSAIALVEDGNRERLLCEDCVSLEILTERGIVAGMRGMYGGESIVQRGIPCFGYTGFFVYDGLIDLGTFRDEHNRPREKILVDKRKLRKQLVQAKLNSINFPGYREGIAAQMVIQQMCYDKDAVDEFSKSRSNGLIGLDEFVKKKFGICRHFALMYQLFAQEAGIESSIVRGEFGSGNIAPWHAWNTARKGRMHVLIDTTGSIIERREEDTKRERILQIEAETESKCRKIAKEHGKIYTPHSDNECFYQYRRLEI
ncbi:MAG TPA: hypothetical protein HA362_06355 [Nanoarchaeota archaeon]|nr:hypothetical protein [Nanoarchaeota archaeon]